MHIITYIHIPVSRQILDPKFPRSSDNTTNLLFWGCSWGSFHGYMAIASTSWDVIPTKTGW